MRSPGRCTNHEACWLGNSQRDIQVAIADPFCCPVCGGNLVPPPLQAITARTSHRALAASVAMVMLAGATGYGSMKLLLDARRVSVQPVRGAPPLPNWQAQPGSFAMAAARMAVPAPPAPAPSKPSAMLPLPAAPSKPEMRGDTVVLAQLALRAPVQHIVVATNVSQETLPATVVPLSFGEPTPPEDDSPIPRRAWHFRGLAPAPRRTEFLPAPGADDSEDNGASQASAIGVDVTNAAPITASYMPVGQTADDAPPATADTAVAPITVDSAGRLPTLEPPPPPLRDETGAPVPDNAPATRADPAEAARLDQQPDAPRRLATLAPAPAAKLAVPSYPPVEAEIDEPGRVNVGCVITVHGLPAGCRVQWRAGGRDFADSVLSWLNSGAVRYRPHLAHGHPVPEARLYQVRFEP